MNTMNKVVQGRMWEQGDLIQESQGSLLWKILNTVVLTIYCVPEPAGSQEIAMKITQCLASGGLLSNGRERLIKYNDNTGH